MSAVGYAAVATAFAFSLALVWLSLRFARARSLYDLPVHRSLHETPTPRLGGVGISLSATTVGLLVLVEHSFSAGGLRIVLAAISGGLVAAATGLADDLRRSGLRPRSKYIGQLAAACVTLAFLVWSADGVLVRDGWATWALILVAVPIAVIWQTALANFTNFMDGADGLVGGIATIILAGYAVASPNAYGATRFYALVCAASTLGFLVMNRPPAKIFMGDTGSLFLGHTIAVVGIWVALPAVRLGEATSIAEVRLELVLAALVLAAPLWVDPLVTLAIRSSRGRTLSQAHRDHLYQRMIRHGASHAGVASVYCGYSLLCVAAVVVMGREPTAGMILGIALVVAGGAAVLIGHRLRFAVEP